MRVGTAATPQGPVPVIERDGALLPIGDGATPLEELIAAGAPLEPAPGAAPLEGARLLAPLRPRKIVAIGLNYLDHIKEAGLEPPERPPVFAKFTTSVIADGDEIRVDRAVTQRVDWEVELAVVIGRTASRVSEADALGHVFGYTVANDVSARDVQLGDGQWVRGKSLDTFCPLGPLVVTADEVPDPQALPLRTRVNGELMQDSTTRRCSSASPG